MILTYFHANAKQGRFETTGGIVLRILPLAFDNISAFYFTPFTVTLDACLKT